MSKIELTPEQKEKVLNEWESRPDDPPSLLESIRAAYPDKPHLDGRSKEGKAVKTFLATKEINPLASHQYQPKKMELTDEHKEFVNNRHSHANDCFSCLIFFSVIPCISRHSNNLIEVIIK